MPSHHPSPFLPFPLSIPLISSFSFLSLLLSFLLSFSSHVLKIVFWTLVSLVDYEHDAVQLTSSLVSNTCESSWLWTQYCAADLKSCIQHWWVLLTMIIMLYNWPYCLYSFYWTETLFCWRTACRSHFHTLRVLPTTVLLYASMKSTVKDLKYMDSYTYCHSVYVCLRSNDALKFHLCCHIWQYVHPLTVM